MSETEYKTLQAETERPVLLTSQAKQDLFLSLLPIKQFNVSAVCREMGISRMLIFNWRKKKAFDDRFVEACESLKDDLETAMVNNALGGDSTMQIWLSKTKLRDRGYTDREYVPPAAKAIIKKIIAGTMDARTGALTIASMGVPVPKVLETMAAQVPPVVDEGSAFVASEEEMDERYKTALEDRDKQVSEFVPARIEEVEEIKRGLQQHEAFIPQEMGI